MDTNIYIQLLDEGTKVYRPVPAREIGNNIYELKGHEIFDREDEEWEFEPGSTVIVEEQNLSGKDVLVAVRVVVNY